jgi:2-iminobutanoate/2-iminopropanoate deaminase
MPHERLNPEGIYKPLRYSQIVTSTGVRQWHIAGTIGFTIDRELVDDMRLQTARTMDNLRRSLEAVGATPAHVVRINIYTADMDRFRAEASDLVYDFFGDTKPASTLVGVPRLANPGYLVEVEATAVADAADEPRAPARPAPHERLNPITVYPPSRNAYSQIVTTTGARQWHISGLVALRPDGSLAGEDDMAAQAEQVVENLRRALEAVGATPAHVVRINVYTTQMDRFRQDAGRIIYGFFGNIRPASTLAGVTALADPRFLVEVEATAVDDRPAGRRTGGRRVGASRVARRRRR